MVSHVAALESMAPPANTTPFQVLQGTNYQTAVIKKGKLFDSLTKPVTTKFGDQAIVVATPKNGNCLPTAMLRGLVNNGYPLSTDIEERAVLALRGVLSEAIKSHNWPHAFVAAPQTLDEAINDTANDGQWCGELAIVSLSFVANVEVHLWRYPSDNTQLSILEPIMSPINPGS
jgi:hypothetical protein